MDVVHHPSQSRVSAMGELFIQSQAHQLLGGWGHIFEALPEGNHRKAEALQVLHHLRRTPAVKGNFPDVVLCAQLVDEGLNKAIVDDISLGGFQIPLLFPHIIGNVIPAHPQVEIILRYPEERQDHIFIAFIFRREYQHEGGNIRGGGKVKAAIARPALQGLRVYRKGAFIPLFHRHPADSLLYPLAEPKLPEQILLGGVLPGAFAGRFQLFYIHRNSKGGVGLFPDLRGSPIVGLIRTINHRIKGGVDFPAIQNIPRLLVNLIADAVHVIARRGNEKIERLLSGVAGAVGHNIIELPVWLGVQLVKYHRMDVEAMLGVCLCGKYLIEAPQWLIDQALLRQHRLDTGFECRALFHHAAGHVEYDGSLLPVGGAAIDLAAVFHVAAGEQQSHRSGQLGFSLFLGDLDVCGIKLAVAVGLHNAKQIPDDLLLPVNKFKVLSVPLALGMLQAADKGNGQISQLPVIGRAFRHEAGGLVFL